MSNDLDELAAHLRDSGDVEQTDARQAEPLSDPRLVEIRRYLAAEYPYETFAQDMPWGGAQIALCAG